MNPLLLTKVDNLLLGQLRVVLDLVDGGDDGGVREEFFEVAFAVLFCRFKLVVAGMWVS